MNDTPNENETSHPSDCPACKGSGWKVAGKPELGDCPACNGTGRQ